MGSSGECLMPVAAVAKRGDAQRDGSTHTRARPVCSHPHLQPPIPEMAAPHARMVGDGLRRRCGRPGLGLSGRYAGGSAGDGPWPCAEPQYVQEPVWRPQHRNTTWPSYPCALGKAQRPAPPQSPATNACTPSSNGRQRGSRALHTGVSCKALTQLLPCCCLRGFGTAGRRPLSGSGRGPPAGATHIAAEAGGEGGHNTAPQRRR